MRRALTISGRKSHDTTRLRRFDARSITHQLGANPPRLSSCSAARSTRAARANWSMKCALPGCLRERLIKRASVLDDLASVSPSVRPGSRNLRRPPLSVSHQCASRGASISRRASDDCAPLQLRGEIARLSTANAQARVTIAELTAARMAAEAEAARHAAADAEAQAEIARLTAILKAFQRHRFGARSEQIDEDQLALVFEDLGQALAHAKARVEAARPKRDGDAKRSRRATLPAQLERVKRVIAPESTACPCCAGPMHVMGEDVAERLDVVPASFRVLVTRRPRYACRACEGAVA